jgi:diaminopimelate decarboxylase
MMNYKIIDNSSIFNVIETTTEQVIKTFTTMHEAKHYMRYLNFGGGFDGWTPQFMLKKIPETAKKDSAVL